MSEWHFILLPMMSGWVALLELDAVYVGQWMLSRPLFVGPLLGLICGQLPLGLSVGALFELFALEALPVGTVIPINGAVAAGCAVLMSAGPNAVPVAVAFPAAVGIGAGHRWMESRVRQWRGALGLRALQSLEEDDRVDWEDVLLWGLGPYAALTALWVYLAVALLGPILVLLWGAAPLFLREGLDFGFRAAAGIGLGVLTHALLRKS
ncbi:MAG: PTS sugar transporter subunit IIC [Elusimicrobiota bacterium]